MIRRNTTPIKMRNYGRILQDTIEYACTLTNKDERQALTAYIAQCMRQKNLVWNRDQESGMERIREDMHVLSNGRLDEELKNISFDGQPANQPVSAVAGQQKKKKK
jgi:hypothetical protein